MREMTFNRELPENLGRPLRFDVQHVLDTVEMFISADEVTTALYILDNMPGYYRDRIPNEVRRLREKLLTQLFTTLDYAKDGCDFNEYIVANREKVKEYIHTERGYVTYLTVKAFNDRGIEPWIYELGPGVYWLPLMLKGHNLKFTYYGKSLNHVMQSQAADYLKDIWREEPQPTQRTMFICFEMLEHLTDTSEIYHHSVKALKWGYDSWHKILISTPLYTYGGGPEDWRNQALGHLRTYTPKELILFGQKHWPHHVFNIHGGPVMVLEGSKDV